LQFLLDCWYCRNSVEHKKDEENVTMVKSRLISKIEWLHEGIPLNDLKIHKKIKLTDLSKSNMSNLYMLEAQLNIIKKYGSSSQPTRTEAEEPPIDAG
jgi:hypothetical protein